MIKNLKIQRIEFNSATKSKETRNCIDIALNMTYNPEPYMHWLRLGEPYDYRDNRSRSILSNRTVISYDALVGVR